LLEKLTPFCMLIGAMNCILAPTAVELVVARARRHLRTGIYLAALGSALRRGDRHRRTSMSAETCANSPSG